MKILVDKLPNVCVNCLFCGKVLGSVISKTEIRPSFTGCKLLEIQLSIEIGTTTRLGNCPLKAIE